MNSASDSDSTIMMKFTTASTLAALAGAAQTRPETLIFADEFNGSQLNTTAWEFDVNCNGGGNNEFQCYTPREDNVYLKDGSLHLRAEREDITQGGESRQYSSGKIQGRNLKSFRYGRIESRMKLPKGRGLWPALWMMPQDSVFGGWAASGEIDIMEYRGQDYDRVEGTVHYSSGWPNNRYTGSGMRTFPDVDDFSADFHLFELAWEQNFMTWSMDGIPFNTMNMDRNWCESPGCPYQNNREPWNQDFYLIFNLAVGGNYLDGPSSDDHTRWDFPELEVDYIRVYETDYTNEYNLDLPECTADGAFPFGSGPLVECCEGFVSCEIPAIGGFPGDGGQYNHFKCLTQEACDAGPPTPPLPVCTQGGLDPYMNGGVYVPCCEGVVDCLDDWSGNGNPYFLCLNEQDCAAGPQPVCTNGGSDPYSSGDFVECCAGLEACVNDWAGNGNWFYLCLTAQDCPTSE